MEEGLEREEEDGAEEEDGPGDGELGGGGEGAGEGGIGGGADFFEARDGVEEVVGDDAEDEEGAEEAKAGPFHGVSEGGEAGEGKKQDAIGLIEEAEGADDGQMKGGKEAAEKDEESAEVERIDRETAGRPSGRWRNGRRSGRRSHGRVLCGRKIAEMGLGRARRDWRGGGPGGVEIGGPGAAVGACAPVPMAVGGMMARGGGDGQGNYGLAQRRGGTEGC